MVLVRRLIPYDFDRNEKRKVVVSHFRFKRKLENQKMETQGLPQYH